MKAVLLLAVLSFTSAVMADTARAQTPKGISPAPEMNLYAAATPEPSQTMLLLLGCAGLVARRRR